MLGAYIIAITVTVEVWIKYSPQTGCRHPKKDYGQGRVPNEMKIV